MFEPRAVPTMAAGGREQNNSRAARVGVASLPRESYSAVYVSQWSVPITPEWCEHTRTAADTGTGIDV